MSFENYVKNKKEFKIQISLENYKEKLQEELNNLIFEPDSKKLEELKENLIDNTKLSRLLEEIDYPDPERVKIILKTNNPKKIAEERKNLLDWDNSYKVISLLFFYESIFHLNSLTKDHLDKIGESYCDQVLSQLSDLEKDIFLTLDTVKWRNHAITLEAIYPEKGYLLNKILLKVGDSFNKKFVIDLNKKTAEELPEETDLPLSLKEDSKALIESLFNINKNKVAILYMSRPMFEHEKIEETKKQIILGIKQFLPFNAILTDEPVFTEGFDVWKVRTNSNKLKKINNEYFVLDDDIPLNWIKEYEKQHKIS